MSELILDQDIGSYWDVLKPKVQSLWLTEEAVSAVRLDMPCLSAGSFQELAAAKKRGEEEAKRMKEAIEAKRVNPAASAYKKPERLQGVHNYDILANPAYQEKYHYVPCHYPGREEYVISRYKDPDLRLHCVDLPRLVINLAYMRKAEARALQFSAEYIDTHFTGDKQSPDL